MASPPHNMYCPTSVSSPEPVGFCDRCNRERYLRDLPFQYDWRGANIVNLQLRVCVDTCYDTPNEQLRPLIIGPDPVPLQDPRPGFWAQQEGAPNNVPTTGGGYGLGTWSGGSWSIGNGGNTLPDFIE